jgi:exodeoxyribonuclease-3
MYVRPPDLATYCEPASHTPAYGLLPAKISALACAMKIATFNINNVNRRLPNLLQWLKSARPDIVCLQELKATDKEFPADALRKAGYHAVWKGEKTWNGVAILARHADPILTREALPGDPHDDQSRYIEAAVKGILVGCIYLPNGNPQPGPKFDYKLKWFKRLAAHGKALLAEGVPVVLAGDYNVAPTPQDIYPTKSWDGDALVQPESRAAYANLLKQGWTDAIRALHPDATIYTYWDYMRNRWPRDAGLRLDHLLLSPSLAKKLESAGVDRALRGKPGASDHAPAWVVLKEARRPVAIKKTRAKKVRAATKQPPRRRATSTIVERRPLLVVDGDSFAHRAYHGLPKSIRMRGGKPGGAVVGFANSLIRFYLSEQPRAVLVGWDTLDVPTYRHQAFPPYQSGWVFDRELLEQLALLPEFVAACGFANGRAPGYEADDFLAAAVKAEGKRKGVAVVASGDRDTFQLASPSTTILFPARGETERIGPAEVKARYGVEPKQVPDFIALRGDPSDKLPGAKGIGAVGAAGLIRKYGSLDALLADGKLQTQADALRLYRRIATMDPRAPLPPLRDQKPTWSRAAALARSWELKALAERLEKLAND